MVILPQTRTYRALKGDYGLHNHLKRLEWLKRPVHHRFARSADNIAIVSESVAEDPNVSIPCRSQELGLP